MKSALLRWTFISLGLCLALLLRWAWKKKLFDPKDRQKLHSDGAVLRHELGHALTWFGFGGRVDKITFIRLHQTSRTSSQYLLTGRTRYNFRNGIPEESADNAEMFAQRILAGESAARKWAGMNRNSICTGGLEIRRGSNVRAILSAQADNPDDFIGILRLAERWGQSDWHYWISSMLSRARIRVDANWAAIQCIASEHEHRLPSNPGDFYEIDGEALMAKFRAFITS